MARTSPRTKVQSPKLNGTHLLGRLRRRLVNSSKRILLVQGEWKAAAELNGSSRYWKKADHLNSQRVGITRAIEELDMLMDEVKAVKKSRR